MVNKIKSITGAIRSKKIQIETLERDVQERQAGFGELMSEDVRYVVMG